MYQLRVTGRTFLDGIDVRVIANVSELSEEFLKGIVRARKNFAVLDVVTHDAYLQWVSEESALLVQTSEDYDIRTILTILSPRRISIVDSFYDLPNRDLVAQLVHAVDMYTLRVIRTTPLCHEIIARKALQHKNVEVVSTIIQRTCDRRLILSGDDEVSCCNVV